MSFVTNSCQQISLFDKLTFLSKRRLKMLENSWAQVFSDHVFTKINEHIFAPFTAKIQTADQTPRLMSLLVP